MRFNVITLVLLGITIACAARATPLPGTAVRFDVRGTPDPYLGLVRGPTLPKLTGADTEGDLLPRLANPFKKKKASARLNADGSKKERWFHTEGEELSKYRKARAWMDTKKCMAWNTREACTRW